MAGKKVWVDTGFSATGFGLGKWITERRDTSKKGVLRRLEEKTIWNCDKCRPRLCTCKDRKLHGVHKSAGSV